MRRSIAHPVRTCAEAGAGTGSGAGTGAGARVGLIVVMLNSGDAGVCVVCAVQSVHAPRCSRSGRYSRRTSIHISLRIRVSICITPRRSRSGRYTYWDDLLTCFIIRTYVRTYVTYVLTHPGVLGAVVTFLVDVKRERVWHLREDRGVGSGAWDLSKLGADKGA